MTNRDKWECPNCEQAVTAESTSCPSCGETLMPVIGDEKTEAKARPGWLVFTGVAVAVLAVGLGAFALTGARAATAVLADRIPGGAAAYVEIDLAEVASDEMAGVIEAFAPLIEKETGEPFDLDQAIDEMLASFDEELAEVDMSFEDDIASWADGPVAIGVFADPEAGVGAEPEVAMVVSGGDAAALDGFLAKLSSEADGTEEIAGVEFLRMPGEHDGEPALLARVDNDLIVASTATLAESMVGGGPVDSLAADDDFNAQVSALADPGFLLYAVDLDVVAEASAQLPDVSGMGGIVGMGDMADYATGWMAGSVALDDGNIRSDYVATVTDAFTMPAADPAVEAALPSDTIAFLRVGSLFEQFGMLAETGMLGGMEQAYGITLDEVRSLFGVDGALAVWPSTDPEIPVNAALVGVGEEDGRPVIDKVAALLGMLQYPFEETDHGYRFENLVDLGTRDNLTFLTTQRSLIEADPAQSFADGDLRRRAGQLVDGDIQVALDAPALVDLVDGLVATDDPEAAEKLACLPVGVVAGGADLDGSTMRASMVVEVTPRC